MSAHQEQLAKWFSDQGFKPKHLRWEQVDINEKEHPVQMWAGRVIFSTTKNNYFVNYNDHYLGLGVNSRVSRPGETWNRGNDLHDGDFSEETFKLMLRDVLLYELRVVSTEEGNAPWLLVS